MGADTNTSPPEIKRFVNSVTVWHISIFRNKELDFIKMFNISRYLEDLRSADFSHKVLLLMLFLFPVFSLSIRHWLSGFYSLIFLASLFLFWRKHKELERDEKIILIAFILFILSFLLSATLNGWTDSSLRRLGAELKLVMFFPVYFTVRQQPHAIRWLFAGVIIGGVVLGLQALYDTLFTQWKRGAGIYGPIIFGDLGALYFGFLTVLYLNLRQTLTKQALALIVLAVFLSATAAILSGSRNAWLAMIVIMFLIGILYFRQFGLPYLLKASTVFLLGVVLLILSTPSSIYIRANTGINEFANYMDIEKRNNSKLEGDSVGIRLEQWRVATHLVLEKPIFGFGGGNAGRETNRYVKLGKAHPDLYNEKAYTGYAGAHSAYFETMVTEGLTGLTIFLFILFFPLFIFIKSRKSHPLGSDLGIIFSISFMIFSLTENPFVHDNFLSTYFVYFSVLFSSIIVPPKESWWHNANEQPL